MVSRLSLPVSKHRCDNGRGNESDPQPPTIRWRVIERCWRVSMPWRVVSMAVPSFVPIERINQCCESTGKREHSAKESKSD